MGLVVDRRMWHYRTDNGFKGLCTRPSINKFTYLLTGVCAADT